MECALACPDNAIPNTGHELGDLLGAAIDAADLSEADRSLWYGSVPSWAAEIRSLLLSDSAASDLAAVARTASATLGLSLIHI